MDNAYSHDSLYPDKWDKPIIIYGDDEGKEGEGEEGNSAEVITNNIKNDKDRFIPPLHIITRDSGYSYNSNYGYLDTSKTDNPDILDNYYYSSQRTDINNDLERSNTDDKGRWGVREGKRVIDSIKGNGRIIPSNKDTSQYINCINCINGNKSGCIGCNYCVGCSCCGGVVGVDNRPGVVGVAGVADVAGVAGVANVDNRTGVITSTNAKANSDIISTAGTLSKTIIPQLEPRYTSVIIPTNGYTWASTPMPNTDNYYVDLIKRPYSPILFSQNGKQLGYRYEQVKTGQHSKDIKEPYAQGSNISVENINQYNNINKYIFIITAIVIIFVIVKYRIPPFA